MAKTPLVCENPNTALKIEDLHGYAEEWFLHGEYQQRSNATLEVRRVFIKNFFWFFKHRNLTECNTAELKQFFLYLRKGHEEPGGRWGNKHLIKPLRPISIKDYYNVLRIFFEWMIREEIIETSPLQKIERPQAREEIKQPLSKQQTAALLLAAKSSSSPFRNECIILMLVDSGARASELINLKVSGVDLKNGSFEVIGKGNKKRMCYFGKNTAKSMAVYLRKSKLPSDSPLFPRTKGSHEPLSRSGLLHLIKRLAKKAGIEANVHQLRRTFATSMLEAGADIVSVRDLLGHTNIQMTLKYLSVAQSHIEGQHRLYSPGDRMKTK